MLEPEQSRVLAVVLVILSGMQTGILTLGVLLLSDLRKRVMRLETIEMGRPRATVPAGAVHAG